MSGSWSNTSTNLIVLIEQVTGFSGIFGYSPAPGAGNLVFSLAAAGGTDPYGNQYLAGLTTYNTTTATYAQLMSNALNLGVINSGTPDQHEAGSLLALDAAQGQGIIVLESGFNTAAGLTDSAALSMEPGNQNAVSSQFAPFMQLLDTHGNSPVDLFQSGNSLKMDNLGNADIWETPIASAAGWNIGTLIYRRNTFDETRWVGSVNYSGAAVAGAGAATAVAAVAAAWRPAQQWKAPLAHLTSTGVQKNTNATAVFNTDGTVSVQWGDGVAGSAHDVNGLATGDVFWFECQVPLGHIL